MFVSLIAVSNTCADGLHASELNTEFLELSGLVCCATGYHHIIQSCLESTEKPQLCLEAWIWVCASSQQSSGRLVFTSGERCLVVRTCSHHAASWAASPQAPFPQCMGTLKPSTSLYSDTIILHLKALICGPGLKIYVAALCIFLFLWRKRNKDGKKKTNPRWKVLLTKQYCISLEHLFNMIVVLKMMLTRKSQKKKLLQKNSCNLMDVH